MFCLTTGNHFNLAVRQNTHRPAVFTLCTVFHKVLLIFNTAFDSVFCFQFDEMGSIRPVKFCHSRRFYTKSVLTWSVNVLSRAPGEPSSPHFKHQTVSSVFLLQGSLKLSDDVAIVHYFFFIFVKLFIELLTVKVLFARRRLPEM